MLKFKRRYNSPRLILTKMANRKKIFILIVFIIFMAAVLVARNYKFKPVAGSATLSWNANAEADVAGYKIYYGAAPRTGDCPDGGYAKNTDVGKVSQYTLNDLEAGQTYYFSVTSYNNSGKESCFSEEMSKSISILKFSELKKILGK